MEIVKLNQSHFDMSRKLFESNEYACGFLNINQFIPSDEYVTTVHNEFGDTYLSGLKNYHAYGIIDSNETMLGLISFYESIDDASWYGTNFRNSGNKEIAHILLDKAIEHNESKGRFKFYSLYNSSSFEFSDYNKERYDYFDEFVVPPKHQCQFNLPWQTLYTRTLIPADSTLRCSFLKKEFRHNLYCAGRL